MSDDFDPLDELASAHLDGDPEAAADPRAAGDPSFEDRLAALGAVSERLGADLPRPEPELRAGHLAAALTAFDEMMDEAADDGASATPAPDADQAPTVADRSPIDGSPDGAPGLATVTSLERRPGGRRRADRGGRQAAPVIPSWLGAAAAALILAGGLGLVLRGIGDSESEDSATAAVESADAPPTTTAGDEAADGALRDATGFSDEATTDGGESAAGDDAGSADGDGADRDGAAEPGADSGGDESEESADDSELAAPGSADSVAAFDAPPTTDELDELVDQYRADGEVGGPEASRCGSATSPPTAGAELAGVLPVTVAGEAVEVLIYRTADGDQSYVLVDQDCVPVG